MNIPEILACESGDRPRGLSPSVPYCSAMNIVSDRLTPFLFPAPVA
jgi:hypothetical protein